MHLQVKQKRVLGKSRQAAVQRAESCPEPEVLKHELALSSPLRGTAAVAAAALTAARALAATSYAHPKHQRGFFHTSSESSPILLDHECCL